MFTHRKVQLTTLVLMVWFVYASPPGRAADIGTAFSYQGSLEKPAGTSVDGVSCDFRFGLWDAAVGGNQQGVSPQTKIGVGVAAGVFTVPDLDFGAGAIDGAARWLEIEVQCPPDVGFTLLLPRVELTPVPYALRAAEGVGPPGVLEVTPTGELDLAKDLGAGMANHLLFDANNWTMAAFSDTSAAPLTIESRSSFNGDRTQLLLDATSYSATIAGQVAAGNTAGIAPPPKLRVSLVTATANTAATDAYVSIAAYDADDVTPVMLRLKSGDTNTMNVTTAGNVGIGTDTPAEQLDVAGNIHASGTIQSGNSITIDGTSGNESISSSASLDLRTAAGLALRLEDNATSPNIIGGYSGNTVTAGALGATIAGGGESVLPNQVTDDYGTVGGGRGNKAGDGAGTTADRSYNTVGGGVFNTASGSSSTVGGGSSNTASASVSTIGGGYYNYAGSLCVGGANNGLRCVSDSDCPGGVCPVANYSTIGGGFINTASGEVSTVGGGNSNTASGLQSTVGGGYLNTASGSYYSTVGGGAVNTASGNQSTVGGGSSNTASGAESTVPGGYANEAGGGASFAAGYRAHVRGIALGDPADDNGTFIWADTTAADFISSGSKQFLIRASGGMGINKNNPAAGALDVAGNILASGTIVSGSSITIDGTSGNESISSSASLDLRTAAGRALRLEDNATSPNVIGGFSGNSVTAGIYGATIGGGGETGFVNSVTAIYGTVGGGADNTASGQSSTVAGGGDNTASSLGSTVGGGGGNTASGALSTVPGGQNNQAGGDRSFAAGRQAKANHDGTFVWADSTFADFISTGQNQFLIRASGGTKIYSNSTATVGVELAAGGNSWSAISDRHVKENLTPVDSRDVLERLAAIPIGEWNLISQNPSIRHIGPMAQDFYAAFCVGEMDTHISSSDADGVALAAIQGLYQIVQEKDCEIEELGSEISNLQSEISELKEIVNALSKQNGGGR